MEVGVLIADEEMNFQLHDVFAGAVGPTEQEGYRYPHGGNLHSGCTLIP